MLALLALTACGDGEGRKRAVECQSDDDCDSTTLGVCDTVSCEDNSCVLGSRPDGHRCDDADPLTSEDSCLSSICTGVAVTCEGDLGPCLKAVHDPETDECVVEPAEDDTPCDDDDACTQVDTCQAGACAGGEAKTCAATDECHVDGVCDAKTGECEVATAEDGAPCDDGQACTSDDACHAGACGGDAVSCDDGVACSVDSCDDQSGACAADMSGCTCEQDADCDDHNACSGQEVCGPDKRCQMGEPVVCPSSIDPCLHDVCVAETGACEPEPVPDGDACDDHDACTTRDTCQSGLCEGGDATVCAPLSQCHVVGQCNQATGACSNPEKPKNRACNDGNACTVSDTCQAGACVGGAQTSCSAADQCHGIGACDTASGICSKPSKADGVACNDANPCTSGDACQGGACTPTAQKSCPATDNCHAAGACDVKTGNCTNPAKPDGTPCNDDQICFSADTCTGGACKGTKVVCDDKVACTVDSCSEVAGGCTVDKRACACQTSADCDDGNACNGVETCNLLTLQCLKGVNVDCSALNDVCLVGACSPATGACSAVPKANDTACDDGNLCTASSSCQAGVCKGFNPTICLAADQCHDAGTCNSGTGKCTSPLKANGTPCNDGNECTLNDSCQGGACTSSSAVVCPTDQCLTNAKCDTSSGKCSYSPKPNGTACNDGSLCTQGDSCQGGACSGATVTCTASDQCHDAGTCDPAKGCSNPIKADGKDCSDGDACTLTDTCRAGVCKGGNSKTCTASDLCHTAGVCDPVKGTCSNPTAKDGTACDDNSACTLTDTCSGGVCKGSSPVVCTASDQCHDAGTCDVLKGVCSNPSKADNTPCGDGKACTSGDKCTAGKCGGAAVTCDDKIACSVDSCVEPAGCNFDTSKCGCTKDADCVDADACNGVETCDLSTLTCKRGTAVNCSALDDACNTGTCNSQTGACKATPKTDGISCDDSNACTRTDTCVAGKCTGGNSVTCTPQDQCHVAGVCDKVKGTCSNPNATDGTGCSDGNKCTQTDACKAGACIGSSSVVCSPQDQCHDAGVCDITTGTCSNPVHIGGCDDGDACTQTDTCQTGVCKGANPVGCTAQDQCHDVGTCNPKNGQCSNPNKTDGAGCDDADKCTQTDSCQTGKCVGAQPVTCPSNPQCYAAGECDPKSGACSTPFAPSGTRCNDANACTASETCDGKGNCGAGSTVICQPPADTCQTNTCNTTLGCVLGTQPNGTSCDDAKACTLVDQCRKGVCTGGSKRLNVNGDWADDPGTPTTKEVPIPQSNGPISVDLFTDKDETVHAVGTYTGPISVNDKNVDPPVAKRALIADQETGIYWARYSADGAVIALDNLGGVPKGGTLTVSHATSHPKDGSFSLLGTVLGKAAFGLNGKTVTFDATKGPYIFVVHYLATGEYAWSARFAPQSQSAFTADSIAAFDDGSLIAIGANAGTMSFFGSGGASFGGAAKPGVWAARLGPDGVGKWGLLALTRTGKSAAAQAVTTLDDGGAVLTGGFNVSADLGPKAEVTVKTLANDAGRDIWFEKLDKDGNHRWGGRVGGDGADIPGDVAPVKGGGALLLANSAGLAPNANDSKNTQQLLDLHATPAGLQAHVLNINAEGVIQSDGLIANPESGVTHGWQLKLDANGFYAVGGTFATGTSFYSSVGFGTGTPKNVANFSISSAQRQPGPDTLFLARVDAASVFDWAVQAGGDNSGMATPAWDVVMTAHPSHSATLAGIFNNTATFGDQQTESLQSWFDANGGRSTVGSPFIVHLNSQAEYDYCP